MSVYSVVKGNNADLIADVARLYMPQGARVADVTYGKGVFWRRVAVPMTLMASDLMPHPKADRPVTRMDFRRLAYRCGVFNIVVLDPPYVHNPGSMLVDANYQNRATTAGCYHDDIMDLYTAGMTEAKRVLVDGGMIWVKCKDEIESSWQRWSVVELHSAACDLGLYAKDLFILLPHGNPTIQYTQQHARKSHSYLWVFKLPSARERRQLAKNASKYRYGVWPKVSYE